MPGGGTASTETRRGPTESVFPFAAEFRRESNGGWGWRGWQGLGGSGG